MNEFEQIDIDDALWEIGALATYDDDGRVIVKWRRSSGLLSSSNKRYFENTDDLWEAINDGSLLAGRPPQILIDEA